MGTDAILGIRILYFGRSKSSKSSAAWHDIKTMGSSKNSDDLPSCLV